MTGLPSETLSVSAALAAPFFPGPLSIMLSSSCTPYTHNETFESKSSSPSAVNSTLIGTSTSGSKRPEVGVTLNGETLSSAPILCGSRSAPYFAGSEGLKRHQSKGKIPILRSTNCRDVFSPLSTGPKFKPRGGVTYHELYTAVTPTRTGATLCSTGSLFFSSSPPVSKSVRLMPSRYAPSRSVGTSNCLFGVHVTLMVCLPEGGNSSSGASMVKRSLSHFRANPRLYFTG
mmetsp:Transcript_64236/g.112020  ORF Transcript_64236/g.112020 Transcript_64236/m.112020 type:complete len:231 (-) Transcript_64236:2975-3667(-)